MTFIWKPNSRKTTRSSFIYNFETIPLIFLAIASIIFGLLTYYLINSPYSSFYGNSLFNHPNHAASQLDIEYKHELVSLIPLLSTFIGSFAVLFIVFNPTYSPFKASNNWFDYIYSYYLIYPFISSFATISFKYLDRGFFEYLGPSGLQKFTIFTSNLLFKTDTGVISHYTLNIILALLFILYIATQSF